MPKLDLSDIVQEIEIKNLDNYVDGINEYFGNYVDDLLPVRDNLILFLKELDEILIKKNNSTLLSLSSLTDLFNSIFDELNPRFIIMMVDIDLRA